MPPKPEKKATVKGIGPAPKLLIKTLQRETMCLRHFGLIGFDDLHQLTLPIAEGAYDVIGRVVIMNIAKNGSGFVDCHLRFVASGVAQFQDSVRVWLAPDTFTAPIAIGGPPLSASTQVVTMMVAFEAQSAGHLTIACEQSIENAGSQEFNTLCRDVRIIARRCDSLRVEDVGFGDVG
jgi:hypothetical protein